MDRVFLDANVLFSRAYGSPGVRRLWDQASEGRCVLLASEYTIQEARRNLSEGAQRQRLEDALEQIEVVGEGPLDMPCPVDLPPKDRPVLMAALAASATHLLTGDIQHFGVLFGKVVRGVEILRPAEFLQRVSRGV